MSDRRRGAWLWLVACATSVAVVASACAVEGPGTNGPNATSSEDDARAPGTTDAPDDDGGAPSLLGDAGPGDDGILGTLSGTCGEIRARLADPSPSLHHDKLTFTAGEVYERASLSSGGAKLYDVPNAGGSSTESEVMSYEVLRTCEGATLLKTETEIRYALPEDGGAASMTDLLVEIDGKKIGVSVTRAYKPKTVPLTDADLFTLLEKKLQAIAHSTDRVVPEDAWERQILHVFAVDAAAAEATERVWKTLSPALRGDTLVLVTQTEGGGFLYCNPDPPLGSECD